MNIKKYLISVILATSLIACNNTNNNTDKAKEPEIKKTYTIAEQHQIWKDEITKLVPSGYKIEFNFEKIEDMLFNHKEAELCFSESKKNFVEFVSNLKNAKTAKDDRYSIEIFLTKYKILNDTVCQVLANNLFYADCAKFLQNTMDFTNANFLKDDAQIKIASDKMDANTMTCSASLMTYKEFVEKKQKTIDRKLATFAGGEKPPFPFCESIVVQGTPKHFCKITEFQKVGLVSKFE